MFKNKQEAQNRIQELNDRIKHIKTSLKNININFWQMENVVVATCSDIDEYRDNPLIEICVAMWGNVEAIKALENAIETNDYSNEDTLLGEAHNYILGYDCDGAIEMLENADYVSKYYSELTFGGLEPSFIQTNEFVGVKKC